MCGESYRNWAIATCRIFSLFELCFNKLIVPLFSLSLAATYRYICMQGSLTLFASFGVCFLFKLKQQLFFFKFIENICGVCRRSRQFIFLCVAAAVVAWWLIKINCHKEFIDPEKKWVKNFFFRVLFSATVSHCWLSNTAAAAA